MQRIKTTQIGINWELGFCLRVKSRTALDINLN